MSNSNVRELLFSDVFELLAVYIDEQHAMGYKAARDADRDTDDPDIRREFLRETTMRLEVICRVKEMLHSLERLAFVPDDNGARNGVLLEIVMKHINRRMPW